MGLVLQAHQTGAADLVQQLVVVLHTVHPLVQVVLEGLGDGHAGGGVIGSLLGPGSGLGQLLVLGLGRGGLLSLGGSWPSWALASSASWYLGALSYSFKAWESLS